MNARSLSLGLIALAVVIATGSALLAPPVEATAPHDEGDMGVHCNFGNGPFLGAQCFVQNEDITDGTSPGGGESCVGCADIIEVEGPGGALIRCQNSACNDAYCFYVCF